MILADKIITLRKKNGWSQEELAEKLGVTRQSVSKWEGAQSVPDLNKILLMSRIFEVSTDFLLKDELEMTEENQGAEIFAEKSMEDAAPLRKVTMEEARGYLELKERMAGKVAGAVFLCIVSPVCLIFLSAAQEAKRLPVSENMAAGIGLTILLLMVAAAVAVFIRCETKTKPYEYLDTERFETEYGVTGMVKERKSEYQESYTRCNIIGTCCCILAAIPLFGVMMFTEEDFALAAAVCGVLALVAAGVWFFVAAGTRWESMQKLLQEGDYSVSNKEKNAAFEPVCKVYWLLVTAVYLGWSFFTDGWRMTWIIWPVAGVLFAAVKNACMAVIEKRNSRIK